jgi:hypothetical protein
MPLTHAVTLTENVSRWLANSLQPRILHVFDEACNLINERKEVLSVVTAKIGNGPLNLVVKDELSFLENLYAESEICVEGKNLHLGDLTIHTAAAKLWDPRPDWQKLYAQQDRILAQLQRLQITNSRDDVGFQLPDSLIGDLCSAVAKADIMTASKLACHLAGLGIGLTPAGDDYLIGAMHATWILHPPEVALVLAREIAEAAAPLTTSLSAALLRSAAAGEAGIVWHDLLDALISDEALRIQVALDKLLAVGESSGADALAGFARTFQTTMAGV